MGVDQLLGALFALILAGLAVGGVSRGQLSGPAGLAYVRRADRALLFWAVIFMHLAGAAASLLMII
jgi:hypothetical protein